MAATTFKPRAGILARLAHWLGRTWARGWNKAGAALVSAGLPPKAAKAAVVAAKIAIAAVLLYVAFWLLLAVLAVAALALLARSGVLEDAESGEEEEETSYEWRIGPEGDGLYDNSLGIRIDHVTPRGEDLY